MLLNYYADIQVNKAWRGASPLYQASNYGHSNVVRQLLDRPDILVNLGYGNLSPLFEAARQGHIEVVRLLLGRKEVLVNKFSGGITPLQIAVENGHYEVAEMLSRAEALRDGPVLRINHVTNVNVTLQVSSVGVQERRDEPEKKKKHSWVEKMKKYLKDY